jgi:ABC-type oligopeptide transport system ATPase subunit
MSWLHAKDLTVTYGSLRAVDGVELSIARGETVGLVGESGSGKSTLGKVLLGLVKPAAGELTFDGISLVGLNNQGWRPLRRRMQMIFQDPYGSLNPRLTAGAALAEVVHFHAIAPDARAEAMRLLERVGLRKETAEKYPHELSGGQRQRVGIARALAVRPELIIADEPVSALDVSIRAQILNLLLELRTELNLTLLLITHDLSVVEQCCDRALVMYGGKILEELPGGNLQGSATHPYTKRLLSARPKYLFSEDP